VLGLDSPRLLFAGVLQTTDLTYEGLPAQLAYPCSAIDDTPGANRRRPFGTWVNVSATTVVTEFMTTFAPGISLARVQAGLPTISIELDGSEGISGALKQVADLIGGYFYFEDNILHLFQTETSDAPDAIDGTPGRFLDDPPITVSRDTSQLMTRAYGKGHGESTLTDLAALETIMPIADAIMFNPGGGRVIALSQLLQYTGIQTGGGGSMVGPGAAPSVAPALALAAGSGLGLGAYKYAYTDVTAAGESIPSPLGTITTIVIPTPPAPVVDKSFALYGNQGSFQTPPGASVSFRVSYGNGASPSDLSAEGALGPATTYTADPMVPPQAGAGALVSVQVTNPVQAGVTYAHLWISVNGSAYTLAYTFTPPSDGPFGATGGMNYFGVGLPAVNATQQRVSLSGIAIGASPTTSRKIYRTAVGGTQLKLLTTLADNTTTVFADTIADGSLGANAPTSDTSGIAQPAGQVLAGVTPIPFASAAPFSATGGWVILGSQQVRYTGVSGNTITGVPATGPGALLATVRFGEHGDVPHLLLGVTGNARAIPRGTSVNIWVQRDDLAAQAAQAAIDAANSVVPADGIYEGPPIVDERRGEASLIALCDAALVQRSRPIVTVTYACRDPKTRSGKTVHIDVATPPIGPLDLTIQDVTISEIDVSAGTLPRFAVTASTVRYSLEDILRRLIAAQQASP